IWGTPTETGRFPLTVEVSDSEGKKASKEFVLVVLLTGDPSPFADLPWLFKEIRTRGALRIENAAIPDAVVGKEYSATLLGGGGKPFKAPPKRPGSGRYWEFADDTLLGAY